MYNITEGEEEKCIHKDAPRRKRFSCMMYQPFSDFNQLSLPSTVDEVVALLYADLSLRDKVVLSQLSENQLESEVYLEMAKIIRKEFGLCSGNSLLLASCAKYLGTQYDSYEDPAMVIIKELWKRIKKSHNLRLVANKRLTTV